jgi:hypothetical protein
MAKKKVLPIGVLNKDLEMTQFVVREIEYGGDVDGTGSERWLGTAVAWFDTTEKALEFADNYFAECEVVEELDNAT